MSEEFSSQLRAVTPSKTGVPLSADTPLPSGPEKMLTDLLVDTIYQCILESKEDTAQLSFDLVVR
jgi:hypothetical protein